jgi:hypothetical protein
MKYFVSFQFLPKGADRPIDHLSASDFETDGTALIPNVGDYVQIIRVATAEAPSFDGKVRSRLFRYFERESCGVNIVVAQDEDDWGKLIKE